MPRTSISKSVDSIIHAAVQDIVSRVSRAISDTVANRVSAEFRGKLNGASGRARLGPARRRARARVELTRWVADRRARRVPKFVIKATGLDTKKKIVAKYGANAAFEKGKAPPRAK